MHIFIGKYFRKRLGYLFGQIISKLIDVPILECRLHALQPVPFNTERRSYWPHLIMSKLYIASLSIKLRCCTLAVAKGSTISSAMWIPDLGVFQFAWGKLAMRRLRSSGDWILGSSSVFHSTSTNNAFFPPFASLTFQWASSHAPDTTVPAPTIPLGPLPWQRR